MAYFCYKLELYPQYYNRDDWHDRETGIVTDHFNYLKELMEKKILFLAGRTVHEPMTDRDFGIVILETEAEDKARNYMDNDPAVKNKLMNAELFQFSVALLRK